MKILLLIYIYKNIIFFLNYNFINFLNNINIIKIYKAKLNKIKVR